MKQNKLTPGGNLLWEGSRMMLPEHKEALIERREELERVDNPEEEWKHMMKQKTGKRPTRDEFELEELGNQLVEANQEGNEILLTIWGWEEQVRGWISNMDSRTGKVHVQRYGETTKVSFMDIMKVESPYA